MTADDFYSLVMFGLDIMILLALVLAFLYIAYSKTGKKEEKE
jgi:hypothetical protein